MPFKLRVGKRTGRYDLSRDLYVIAVQLLDGHILQCTLSTESTGKDCMDYICQRLELQQNIFFGLRYKCSRMVFRWAELDKPLRKQLEKTAQELRLFFGVMFHTPNANSLTDSVARYYYFLQMRADVLDGRLLVSPEKAISLASYSLQIDFGDHEETKPTVATLRGTPLLPRHMTQSSQVLEDLIKQVIVGYIGLRGLTRAQAELLYITEAQQCDGYGEEYFSGRDEDGSDIFVGYCMEGIIVKRLQGPPVKYKWEEIVSILATRRNFIVNCAELAHAHFQMEDVETAKYAAYVCGLHLQFFRNFCKREDGTLSTNRSTSVTTNPGPGFLSFPSQEDQQDQNAMLSASNAPYPNAVELHQQHQQQQHFLAGHCMNGFANSTLSSQQMYLGGGGGGHHHHFASPPLALQSPFSYSTTSVDRLPATAFRFDHQQRNDILQNDGIGCDYSMGAAAMPSLNSPLNPSVSSLGSAPGIIPLPPQQQHQQQRMLPNRLPSRQHDGLQSWMSQQILAASTSNLSLNRSPMSAFNGSVPQIHALGAPYQPTHQFNAVPVTTAANHAQMRLFNGPGRPLSLDEFNLNEMLLTAYEYQQMRQQQSMSPFRPPQQQQQQQPIQQQHRPFATANSEQSIVYAADSAPNANGGMAPPVFHAPPPPPPPPAAPTMASPSTPHPGMQYLASLEAFLNAQGDELVRRTPKSPPLGPAASRPNGVVAKEKNIAAVAVANSTPRPGSGVVAPPAGPELAKSPSTNRPNSAASFSLNHAIMGGSDRHFVSTPDLTSVMLSKSQSSPDLVTKQQHLNRQQQPPQQKKSIDSKTFENLSIENLDSPTIVRQQKPQRRQQADLLRRDSSCRSTGDGASENGKITQKKRPNFVSTTGVGNNSASATPQRIIVGAAASSSGESDEHLDVDHRRRINDRSAVYVSRDASRSTIATSSTSTLPDDSTASGQQAFQRFNPRLYEHQLMMLQREQQIQYRQQLKQEQETGDGEPTAAMARNEIENSKTTSPQANEHHRSVAVLNLKSTDENGKERRKSAGEYVGDEKDTAHRHRLLVNDHGGSSSEEALKSPDSSSAAASTFCHSDEPIAKESLVTAVGVAISHERNGKCVLVNSDFHSPTRMNGDTSGVSTLSSTSTSSEQFAADARLRRHVAAEHRYDNDRENDDSTQYPTTTAAIGANRAMARDSLLKREFELIPKKRVSAGLSTAQRRENQNLNRDGHVLPYEDTRVMLRPNKHNPHGYINASHVQVPIGTAMLKYIATQGPLRETVVDFWQMIWESGCRIIVMLTRCMEHGQEQSFPYWPCQATASEHQKLKFGEYQLALHNCTESRTHVTSTFVLKHTGIGQKRLLYHLQYLDWPEGGVPGSVDSFMSFVDEVNSVKVHVANELTKNTSALSGIGNTSRAASRTNLLDNSNGSGSHSSSGSGCGVGTGGGGGGNMANRKRSTSSLVMQQFSVKGSSPALDIYGNGQNQFSIQQQHTALLGLEHAATDSQLPPVVVHCCSGAGRTGVYLLTEVMINALQHNQDLDMSRALTLLRHKRMLLVQTFPQYRFVFTCIAQYMRKSRLI